MTKLKLQEANFEKVEKKLKESEERYKTLIQTIPDIIYEVDAKVRFTFVSDAIKMLGYNPKELMGKHLRKIIHPDDFEAVNRAIVLRKYKGEVTGNAGAPKLLDERRTGKKMTKSLEVRLISKDQRGASRPVRNKPARSQKAGGFLNGSRNYCYVEVNSSGRWDRHVQDKNKKFLGSIGIIKDISKRKEVEGTLQERRDELVRSEKLAFTGRIAASIAHEIRNPLTNVIMSVKQLKKAFESESPWVKHTDIVSRNIERINFLITELLNCARPPKLDIRRHNIHTLLRNILDSTKSKIKLQNIKVVKRFTPKASIIRFDKEQTQRALSNIIINAIEAMPKGGNLTIVTDLNEDSFVVKIQDTGEGIPEEDIIRIFDPFFTTKTDGVGLGLTLCYGIIASHGGTLGVESKPKEGSVFVASLPLSLPKGRQYRSK